MLIAQLSDTHITLDGPQASDLLAAIAWLNGLPARPDVVLLSGDVTNNGRPDQYARLREVLAVCAVEVVVVPGNHDDRDALRATLPDTHYPGVIGESLNYAIDRGPLRIIGLDTTAPRRPGGILDDASLTWLDGTLAAAPGRPALLFMHHPPFRTGVNLADIFGFKGLRHFESIVRRHAHVRRIVAGHVHCERRTTIGQALVTTGLSSTPQLVPELFERRLAGFRPEPAGFALLTWADDTFTTMTYVHDRSGKAGADDSPGVHFTARSE